MHSLEYQRSSLSDLEKSVELSATFHDRDRSKERAIALAAIPHHPPAALVKEALREGQSCFSSTSSITQTQNPPRTPVSLPQKKYGRLGRNLRWTIFSVYRRLNLVIILINLIIIIFLGVKQLLMNVALQTIATAVAANITLAVLIRQELVINLLFALFGTCPTWMPLRIRRLAAKIYHLGGVHSGAGISAVLWFGVLNAATIRYLSKVASYNLKSAIISITVLLDMLLLSMVILSHPFLRSRFHNAWEAVHRFAGWTAVALFWTYFGLMVAVQKGEEGNTASVVQVIVTSPIFWCLAVITISLVLPWLRLRKVSVHAEPLSNHAVRLHFTYTNLPLCAAPRLSDNPLREWHAFAGIPEQNGTGFSVLVSKAGDWTTQLIQSPPTKIWVRGIPVRGVLHIAPIFRRVVLVATGSGIGPILSLLYARNLSCRIIWSTPDPLKTYKSSIIDQITLADPNAVIINTTKSGRPDLVGQAYRLYKESNAEAIFVISNPKVTRKVVYGLESRGIAVFAPIFDS